LPVIQLEGYEARQQKHGEELADYALEGGKRARNGMERCDVAITDARQGREAEVGESEAKSLRRRRGGKVNATGSLRSTSWYARAQLYATSRYAATAPSIRYREIGPARNTTRR